jgi:sortase A
MRRFSIFLICAGIAIIIYLFGPIIKSELNYTFDKWAGTQRSVEKNAALNFQKQIEVPNTNFSIIIPKINAVAPIVDDVDPYNPDIYLKALKGGVAHASGTPYPGQVGNVYLFAHSTDAFYNLAKYNAVFFLIGHLVPGDEVDIFYRNILYKYTVYDKKVVEATDITYLGTLTEGEKTLTLQTCYPPGTTIKRLVVLAKLSSAE